MEDYQPGRICRLKIPCYWIKNIEMNNTVKNPNIIALIPARSGSKRIPNKNIKYLNGHPLIAYSIISAIDSGIFDRIIVSTDSNDIAKISEYYGAEVPFIRPENISTDNSPDIDLVYLGPQAHSENRILLKERGISSKTKQGLIHLEQ